MFKPLCELHRVGLHSSRQRWFSGAEREMQAEAAPPRAYGRSFAIGRTCSRMLATYRLHQRETSLKTRQVFMAGPDDEQLEAPTFLRGDPRQCLEVWSCLPLRRMAESSAGD